MNVDVAVGRAGAGDLAALERLLRDAALPTDGVRELLDGFAVVRDRAEVLAAAAVERYGAAVLLRSVVVAPAARGRGLGARVVEQRLTAAARAGASDAYLLTTTAEPFFSHLGFTTTVRDAVPADVRRSAEFTSLCPASATVMHRPIGGLR
jgi:amino-acid N-acetyltransferase